jgi:hypothetical protein
MLIPSEPYGFILFLMSLTSKPVMQTNLDVKRLLCPMPVIRRELSRNTGKRSYRHKQTNRLACERHQEKNKAIHQSLILISV